MTDAPREREGDSAWTKLRERKVVQWGLGYAAAAWTLLQVIEYLGDTYGWPPAVHQIATLVLPLGALPVLVLAWYHGDKGEQKVTRPELAILVALLLTLGALLWWYVSQMDETAWIPDRGLPEIKRITPTEAPSVAVLPFVNMSSDPEQEYFADGLSEEILNSLARIPGLFVPARTSSFQFKGQRADIGAFAAKLGVAAVLEGSVRKSGNRLRITAQLINASDGYHLWSQTFDRELGDVFAIQEEISNAIAAALKIRLTARQRAAMATAPPTTNMDAYQAYLLGRFELNKRRNEAVVAAIKHFERAVALDPEFADAYADLSFALSMTGQEYLPTADEEALSRKYLDRAIALAPDRPAVLAAAAYRAYTDARLTRERLGESGELKPEVKAQMEVALDHLERALLANPSNADVYRWRQNALRQLGREGGGFEATEAALKLEPLSVSALRSRIYGLLYRGRGEEAQPLIDRLASVDPPSAEYVLADKAFMAGDGVEGIRHMLLRYDLESEVNLDVTQVLSSAFAFLGLREEAFNMGRRAQDGQGLAFVYWSLGDFERAADEIRPNLSDEQWAYGCTLGHILYLAGDIEGTDSALGLCWSRGVPMLGVGGARLLIAADAARRLGDEEKAARYVRWLEKEFRTASEEGIIVNHYLLAMYHAYQGRWDEAAVELVAAVPKEDFWFEAPHMAMLGDLPKGPKYLGAVKARKAELAKQKDEVLRLLCGPNPVSKKYTPLPETCASWKRK